MKIKLGGIINISLIDVIGYPSAVLFFSGCNFRCPWCQNGPLVLGQGTWVRLDKIIKKLKENYIIDFVQASGGEPTLQIDGLIHLFEETKRIKLKNSLDTNGSFPERIRKLLDLELLDHVAMDVKFPINRNFDYTKVIGVQIDDIEKRISQSLEILRDLDFVEIRTTWVPTLLEEKDIIEIAEFVASISDKFIYVLQQFNPASTILNKEFKNIGRTNYEKLLKVGKEIKEKFRFREVYIRAKELGVYRIK